MIGKPHEIRDKAHIRAGKPEGRRSDPGRSSVAAGHQESRCASPERFCEFRERYKAELNGNPALAELAKLGAKGPVTLLYAAHDPAINHAVVLQSVLRSTSDEKGKRRRREQ
jgi:hypothetical protein